QVFIKADSGQGPASSRLVEVKLPNQRMGLQLENINELDDTLAVALFLHPLESDDAAGGQVLIKIFFHAAQLLGFGLRKQGAFEQNFKGLFAAGFGKGLEEEFGSGFGAQVRGCGPELTDGQAKGKDYTNTNGFR